MQTWIGESTPRWRHARCLQWTLSNPQENRNHTPKSLHPLRRSQWGDHIGRDDRPGGEPNAASRAL